ncbi:fluoride efflux transporter CrcB [Candidatus Uabimicrobium amorphum]|uniref:Fluoride-specific ion channel FluC n=1 Tax=Uabimicrobium amorphum TaxID=2596890 RepID=A0A5S9IP53_UABAM|nr:fluoride efflux transporter CrcB [Candidatus Uabimicrobium amorphum]BBM85107.1 putative fluoride ion transporter CrcB [Candidatus Uabimicrobium amorphum]
MKYVFIVGCGGFIGAVLRYVIGLYVTKLCGASLYGTLTVNVIGCFVLGLLMGLNTRTGVGEQFMSPELRLMLQTGLLGALTTFSTFISDIFHLYTKKQIVWMLFVLHLHLVIGFLCFWAAYAWMATNQ